MNTWCTAHRAPCMRRRILASSPIAREEASEQALVAQRRAELGRVCGSGSQAAVRLQHPLRQHDAGVRQFEQRFAELSVSQGAQPSSSHFEVVDVNVMRRQELEYGARRRGGAAQSNEELRHPFRSSRSRRCEERRLGERSDTPRVITNQRKPDTQKHLGRRYLRRTYDTTSRS